MCYSVSTYIITKKIAVTRIALTTKDFSPFIKLDSHESLESYFHKTKEDSTSDIIWHAHLQKFVIF
jgi:hypothetical protein